MTTRDVAEEARSSPEAVLGEVARAGRTRLRIFVGAAPGVGKTYAMLEAAREREREGVDVVIGVVETHGRKEAEALLEGLEIVPRRTVESRGLALHEMDLDAILQRRPDIVVVDELAHANAPGSRHPRRYSDVEELLDAGIEVYTTVNIQHLESLNDVVTQITGVRVRETVPDVVFERADEIELIDLPPEDLIKRLREGKVHVPAAARRAIENYFKPGNLTALRELALRHAAERVDDEVQRYLQAHAIRGVWAVSERIMVCVSEGPFAERLVRAARRMAARRRAEWIAVYVEPASFQRHATEQRERVAKALRLAERLGGETVTIPGRDVAGALVAFARQRNVTELILGKPLRPWWRDLLWRSPIDEIIRRSGDIEVRVISGEQHEGAGPAKAGKPAGRRPQVALRGYLAASGLVAVSAGVAWLMQHLFRLPDVAMVFLTGVLFAAVWGGLGPSLAASAASLFVYDFFFVEPIFTLTVTKPPDLVLMSVFLIVAVLVSHLTARAQDEAEAARLREQRTGLLYAFSREIAGATGIEDLLPVVAEKVEELLGADVVILLPDRDRLVQRISLPQDIVLGQAEMGAASWVRQHQEAAGPGTDTLPGGDWIFAPLATARGVVGVIGIRLRGSEERSLPLERRQLLEAVARHAAIAIDRTRIDAVLEEKAKTEAVMEAIEDGLIVLDPDGVVMHVNEVAGAILEVERDQVLGRRFEDLASRHPHYLRVREAVREFELYPERERDQVEIALFLRGRDHFFVLRPTPYRTREGQPAGLILALQDVTYFRDQEARREHLVATLSHELGTPITSLRMALELLGRSADALDPEQRDLVTAANEDVVRLQEVSRQFLDLARSRATAIALERESIDVRTVIDRVMRIFATQAKDKDVAIQVDASPVGTVLGDEIKLTWALSNLLANALRYTPTGGRITIQARPGNGDVDLSVSDTGPGIPPEQQERVFERFVQSGKGGDIGGAGLGLAIVRDIVQAHGGRILLESTPGVGTRFTLRLPRC